jgi:DNA repair exonuclease SbcCD ATPase subunit
MVANGINRGELVSRVREFLRGLSREEITRLSRAEFARAIGVDSLNIPFEYKRELARVLHSEFELSYKEISKLLAMSYRDISKAVRGEAGAGKAVKEVTINVDVEIQAKAIELVRSGEARNPNDLVLKLKIPLDIAEQLFNRVVENEKLTLESTVNAVVRIERSIKSIKQYAEKFEELEEKTREKIKEYEEKAGKIVKDLDEALNDKMKMIQDIEKRVEELGNKIFGLGITLTAGGVEIRTLTDLLRHVKQLEDKVSKLEEKHGKLEEKVELIDRRLLSVATEVRWLEEFKEKVEKPVKAR